MNEELVAIIPAAGLGTRLRPFAYPKELLPVMFTRNRSDGSIRPALAIEHALMAIRKAHITNCYIVIADWKLEIIRYLGDGERMGLNIAYLHQSRPLGLAEAIDSGYNWLSNRSVCLVLPDTLFTPINALNTIAMELQKNKADLILGIFPTDRPNDLGPVSLASDGTVLEVLEKPIECNIQNTWGIAAWKSDFTKFVHKEVADSTDRQRQSLGKIFDTAVKKGLKVHGVYFSGGSYIDIGSPTSMLSLFNQETIVDEL